MGKNQKSADRAKDFFPHKAGKFSKAFQQKGKKIYFSFSFHKILSTFHKTVGKSLQAGIDIRGDVPQIILHGGIALFQLVLDSCDGSQDRGMVTTAEFLTDFRGR